MPLPDGQTTWATTAEVDDLTAETVTEGQLTQAQAVMDLHSGRTVHSAAEIGDRDLHYLKLATAYQAAWMKHQPDMYSRMDLTEVPSDAGASAGLNESGMTLGPLARRALRQLSWKRSRSLAVGPAPRLRAGFVNELSDPYHNWHRM